MSRMILIAMLLAVTVAGCNRFPDQSIQVTANLRPSDSECAFTADQEAILPRGRFDLGYPFSRNYRFTPRIESYIIDNSTEIQGASGNMQITSFAVTLKLPDNTIPALPGGLPNPYQVTANAVIPPSPDPESSSAGAALASVIPESYYGALFDIIDQTGFTSIVLDIRANGTTSGGFSQQSPPFSWPIEFCLGCLGVRCEPPNRLFDSLGCFVAQDVWTYCAEIVDPEAEGS